MTKPKPNAEDHGKLPEALREVASEDLFRGKRTVIITHSGEHYRLMITRNDKLILQK